MPSLQRLDPGQLDCHVPRAVSHKPRAGSRCPQAVVQPEPVFQTGALACMQILVASVFKHSSPGAVDAGPAGSTVQEAREDQTTARAIANTCSAVWRRCNQELQSGALGQESKANERLVCEE